MNPDRAFSHPIKRLHDETPHLTREEYSAKAVHELDDQFRALETAVANGDSGRSMHKYLLTSAHDQLSSLKGKGLLSEEQAQVFRERAERLDSKLYEEAA